MKPNRHAYVDGGGMENRQENSVGFVFFFLEIVTLLIKIDYYAAV